MTPRAEAAPPRATTPEPHYRAIHEPTCSYRLAGPPHPCTCSPSRESGALRHEADEYLATSVDVRATNLVLSLLDRLSSLEREAARMRRMLETATIRLGILRDRMEGCREAKSHELSLAEIPAWIDEQTAALSPSGAPETRPPAEQTTAPSDVTDVWGTY